MTEPGRQTTRCQHIDRYAKQFLQFGLQPA